MLKSDEAVETDGWMNNTKAELCGASHSEAPTTGIHPVRARGCRLDRVYYPLGFPIRIKANSPLVFSAAERSWSHFAPQFDRVPLNVQFRVVPNRGFVVSLPPGPSHEFQEDKLILTAGPENRLVVDLKNGTAIGRINEGTVRCQRYFRYHFLEAAAFSLISAQHSTAVHAACVEWNGRGMLLCGDSGAGKSTLAFASMRSGFTFISDDASYVVLDKNSTVVVGNCHSVRFRPSAQELFAEVAGQPITPRATGKPSIEFETAKWPHLRTSPTTHVHYLVFLNRESAGEQELVSIPTDRVREWFQSFRLPIKHNAERHNAALDHLQKCKVFELRYRDLTWATERLKNLTRHGE